MKKILLISMVAGVVASQGMRAYAWGWDRNDRGRDAGRDDRGRDSRGREEVRDDRHGGFSPHYVPAGREFRALNRDHLRLFIGGAEFFFWEGMFYHRMADRYVVVQAPIGAVVTALPPQAQLVVVDGVPYYTVNGVTYISTTYGYQVVPPPRVVVVRTEPGLPQTALIAPPAASAPVAIPPAPAGDESFTVNIPNARGSYSGVTMKRMGNGFVGPQGEFYSEFPKVEQLKLMYGK